MEKEEFILLIRKYLAGQTQPDEEQILLNYFESFQEDEDWDESVLGSKEAMETALLKRFSASVKASGQPRTMHFIRTTWFRYAALLILLLGTGIYLLLQLPGNSAQISTQKSPATQNVKAQDILAGSAGAVLTLADGRHVVLDTLDNGVIANLSGVQIRLNDGLLSYTPKNTGFQEMTYNTMSTPKGKQFQVALPDGTKVWLNAASSLRFPTVFSARDRSVEIYGEAYFEVAKDKARPFLVKVNGKCEIEVLGTSFNVNSYEDEMSINATLLEGSIKVASEAGSQEHTIILKPGQQAQINGGQKSTAIAVLEKADIGKVMAWKNGFFDFDNAGLEEVMRQLARWYDIEVVYEKGIPDIHFVGEMSRHISLAGLIKILEKSEVHFRIEEGRRLVVYP